MSILIERDQKELKKCLKYCLKGSKEFTHKLGVIFENQWTNEPILSQNEMGEVKAVNDF